MNFNLAKFCNWMIFYCLTQLNALLGQLFDKSISIMHWMHVAGFHFITHWRFYSNSSLHRFSAHCFKWLQYNWVELLITNLICNFDTGWVLCHISMVFFFKPQKALLRWLIHLHAKFQPIPSAVYPVGVAYLRPCLSGKSIITP